MRGVGTGTVWVDYTASVTSPGLGTCMRLLNFPVILGVLCFLFLWGATYLTVRFVHGRTQRNPEAKQDFGVLVAAILTLLGLVIGFTFSMAINRYDQRKILEEGEANAIGTEYVRADLLPAADAAKLRRLLKEYTEQRILYYGWHNSSELKQIEIGRAKLQAELWQTVLPMAAAQPTPITSLVVSGMNDALNSQGYAHAAWLNRIPTEAWVLLLLLALLSNIMIAYSARTLHKRSWLLLTLPLVVSVSLTLIADIDSPRHGMIRVSTPNLSSLLESMH